MYRIVFIFAAGYFLVWGGGQSCATGLMNTSATKVSCSGVTDAAWVELEGCVVDLENVVGKGSEGGRATELYLPLRLAGSEIRSSWVVATDDAELLSVFNAQTGQGDPAAIANFLKLAIEPRTYSGVARSGINLDDDERDEILSVVPTLSGDFVLIDHNAEPSILVSGLKVAGGLLLILILMWSFFRRGESDEDGHEAEQASAAA